MNRIALVTGATAGIGKAIAEKFATNKYNLIITGRRKNRLTEIANELASRYSIEVLPLSFDVRKKDEVKTQIQALPEKWKGIDVLVNNAGLALGLSPIQDGDFEDWDTMIDTNVKGLLYMSKFVSNLMIENGKGHIINIGSIAGKEAYPNGNVYCGTKHAVDAITKSMRLDLLKHRIKVSQIAPGAVETEFSIVRFKGNHSIADKVYRGYQPLLAEDVAEVTFYVTTLPEHVNINDLVVMPTAQANATTIDRK